nr:PREDICTED: uncharacterized protein LOC109038603 [Bemisia tabaci]
MNIPTLTDEDMQDPAKVKQYLADAEALQVQSSSRCKLLEENLNLLRQEMEFIRDAKRKLEEEQSLSTSANKQIMKRKIKLPAFRPEMPDLWFIQIEAIFADYGINAEIDKYRTVISQSEGSWLVEINDLIRAGPSVNIPYTTLKKEIINRFSLSENSRLKKLLEEEEIGDLKPSQFLRRLKTVAGSTPIADNIMKPLWLSRLPAYVQGILQAQPSNNTLTEIADVADRIAETIPHSVHSTSATNQTNPSPSVHQISKPADPLSDIKEMLTALSHKFDLLDVKVKNLERNIDRSRSRSRSKSRSRYSSPKPFKSEKGYCFYHENFGKEARKCHQPCKYLSSTNDNGSQ